MKIYFDSYSFNFENVADRRRFGGYLRNSENSDILQVYDFLIADVIVICQNSDFSFWLTYVGSAKLIFDFSDPYLNEPFSLNKFFRGCYKYIIGKESKFNFNYLGLIKRLLQFVDIVVCSSEIQKELIYKFNQNVKIIYDYQHDDITFTKCNYDISPININILWEGISSNLVTLKTYKSLFENLNNSFNIKFHFITDVEKPLLGGFLKFSTYKYLKRILPKNSNFYLYSWNREMFSLLASNSDIAIIPLNLNDPYQNAKSPNKLFLLWRLGIPVVVSASDSYKSEMIKAGLDLYCYSDNDWVEKINQIINSVPQRVKLVNQAKSYVESSFSYRNLNQHWEEVLL
jgi:glycosyltransferase involved in cell wall biosynthesis